MDFQGSQGSSVVARSVMVGSIRGVSRWAKDERPQDEAVYTTQAALL